MYASLSIHEVEHVEFDSFENEGVTWTDIIIQTDQGKMVISLFRPDNSTPPEIVDVARVQAAEQLILTDNARRGIR